MTVVMINPNSTAAMTEAMLKTAERAAPQLQFEGWTSHHGPAAIQGAEDGAAATPPLLDLVREADSQSAQGIIIGCFDDTALSEAAKIARCPVIGIGQAAYHLAALRQWRFSVVTTLPVSVPIIEDNIVRYGFGAHLRKVRASNVAVLDLEANSETSEQRILEEASAAAREDGVDAIVLGCAGMVTLANSVQSALELTVLDPVVAAASCMKWVC